jgi:hypothetical protein
MPDYEEILVFLASNPPQFAAERELHASLLELLAKCLRGELKEGKQNVPDPSRFRKSDVN